MKRLRVKVICISFFTFFVILFILSLIFRESFTEAINGNLRAYGLVALFISSGLLEGFPQYIAPQLLAFNAALLGFQFFETIVMLYLGSIAGSIIAFEIGYGVKKRVTTAFFRGETIEKCERWMNKHGSWVVFVTAISPLPYIPALYGILHLKRRNFFLLGVLPRIISFIYMTMIAQIIF